MPSPSRALLHKEWRELLASRAWWLLLLLIGPLTGMSFIAAVNTYAEVSAAAGETLTPLSGIWAPTGSACELVAVFLLPFVVIRIVGADRQSGALKLELQRPQSPLTRIAAKSTIALAGWSIALLPLLAAAALWRSYGGHIHPPDLLVLFTGHLLNGGLTIAFAAAAASLAEHPSTAAILTLSVTVGTWIITFFAALRGGFWERIAAYTPAAVVAEFQHGLLSLPTLLVTVTLILAGLTLAALWQPLGTRTSRKLQHTAALGLLTALALVLAAQTHQSWDLSENRANSFPLADELALRSLQQSLKITARLAPEDGRRVDLERRAFSKLRRLLPNVEIEYLSATATGLFEQTAAGYGEITYTCNGRTETNRVATAEGVLESIYALTGLQPANLPEIPFRGHPLAVTPAGAGALFYLVWPGLTLLCGVYVRRRFQ